LHARRRIIAIMARGGSDSHFASRVSTQVLRERSPRLPLLHFGTPRELRTTCQLCMGRRRAAHRASRSRAAHLPLAARCVRWRQGAAEEGARCVRRRAICRSPTLRLGRRKVPLKATETVSHSR
jgi:hypothetical protein